MVKRDKEPKQPKFSFEEMKALAMHKDAAIRKQAFIDYFERFKEFPSYLFDNKEKIDDILYETVQDLIKDKGTTTEMRKGIDTLMQRMPS